MTNRALDWSIFRSCKNTITLWDRYARSRRHASQNSLLGVLVLVTWLPPADVIPQSAALSLFEFRSTFRQYFSTPRLNHYQPLHFCNPSPCHSKHRAQRPARIESKNLHDLPLPSSPPPPTPIHFRHHGILTPADPRPRPWHLFTLLVSHKMKNLKWLPHPIP